MIRNPFRRAHLRSALILFLLFALLTLLMIVSVPAEFGWAATLTTTLAAPLGPLTGAVVRGWPLDRHADSGCVEFAYSLVPWCAAALALGILAQWIGNPDRRHWRVVHSLAWIVGWIGWLGGGPISLMVSLE